MKAPEGFSNNKNYFWTLNKALYGLKQTGKEWNNELNNTLNKF